MMDDMNAHQPTESSDDQHRGADRRSVLRSAGVLGGAAASAAVLAACGSSGGGSDTGAAASDTGSTGGGSAASASGGASSAAAGSGDGIATSKVPVGSGVIDTDLKAVITQPTSGSYKAFSYICTHEQCPVTKVDGEKIVCPCHGSEFSIKDGSVLQGPATEPLAGKTATVQGSQVIVS